MLTDGRTVPDGEVIPTDVCIVGAGPAGIALARELSSAGLEILVLERGEAVRQARGSEGTVVNLGLRYPVKTTRAFGFGGSINEWIVETPLGGGMGRLRELDEEDFERREWIPYSGWPFSKDVVRPFYTRARQLFGSDSVSHRPDDEWDTEGAANPFLNGGDSLQSRLFTFANPAIFAAEYRRQLENRENVLVLTNATVAEVQSTDSMATSVRVLAEGRSFSVVARAYVLAAGGLETARILLCSRTSGDHSLGNRHDLVGRFFMEHPHYVSGLLIPTDASLIQATEHHSIHMRDGVPVQHKISLSEETVEREGLPRCVFMLSPSRRTARLRLLSYSDAGTRSIHRALEMRNELRTNGRKTPPLRELSTALGMAPHLVRFGASKAITRAGAHLGAARYSEPQVFKIQAMAEQVPDPASRLILTDKRDAFGLPIGGLDWRLTDTDLAGYRRTQSLLGRGLRTAGHTRVRSLLEGRSLLPGLIGGCHHMGTTRMHTSPRHGVVDANCRLHEARNVFVAGSSVFPTAGYANPFLTTLALTLRLADHLRAELR
jgi:choline dehydrogenase-like flavoprotein